MIIFIGIILYFASQFYGIESFAQIETPLWIWCIFALWLSTVLHTITISVRNVKMLYLFIVKNQ
ncbi:hypothetical protein [Heyndrickxia sporothermodurans]|nr:hypothetical protein [Heyndrickxia sporothermodurans]